MGIIHTSSLTAIALLLAAGAARADAVVTACAADTQAGAGVNLAQALAVGGVIRFDCPAGTTIQVTGRYNLTGSTLIDGGDAVTLDGHGAFGPLLRASENVILRRLTVRGFAQRPLSPPAPVPPGGVGSIGRVTGSVLAASGDAELDHVTIETSDFPVFVHGVATVRDSAFVGNHGGLILDVGGAAHVEHSHFAGNDGVLSITAGWVRSCDFTAQTAGAVRVSAASGPVEIRHSTFTGTRGARPALALSQQAGRSGPQTVTVRANTFQDNDGGLAGGAISVFDMVQEARDRGAPPAVVNALTTLPPASFVLGYNQFIANRGGREARRGGGAITANLAHTGGMVSTGDLFVDNSAGGDGGAVSVVGGALRMSHALFKANHAGGSGAALFVAPDASAMLANALVVGNDGPAGTITGGKVTLANITVADNAAAGLLLEDHPLASAANVLLARNRPADCARVPAGAFRGGALQSDGSCPGVATGEAFLDAFYVPAVGSPALRAGDPTLCRSAEVGGFDLPFQGRLDPATCALGAFEHAPVRKFSFPTDQREAHADKQDDFSDDEGYRPSPGMPSPPSTACLPSPPGTLPALQAVGIDFSVPEADLRQWLNNCSFTPYPAITGALLKLLETNRLRQSVYLDVIVWNYEHGPGAVSPRSLADVKLDRLMAAVVEGYNSRHGTTEQSFKNVVQ